MDYGLSAQQRPAQSSGRDEALRRIAIAAQAGAEELDLGGLGLTEIPDELYDLAHLKILYLGAPKNSKTAFSCAWCTPHWERPYSGPESCNAISALPPTLFTSLPCLTHLHLDQNRLTSLPLEIAALVNLTSLDLGRNHIGADGVQALSSLVNLTSLNLYLCYIGHEGARTLAGLTNLNSLDLGFNDLGAEGVRALSGLVNLTSLNLMDNGIGAKGTWALSSLVNLVSLNLDSNRIRDEGVRALSGLVDLTFLDLRYNHIGAEGARALSGLANLAFLNLNDNHIGDEGAWALSGLVNLTSLNLHGNGVGADGARALSSLINLASLDLWGNDIGTEGAWALFGLSNLTSLNLESNGIGLEGARALSNLINLTSLNLLDNGIGDEGACALSSLVNLASLNLESNCIGVEGARALSDLVCLTSLNLQGNRIGVEGAWALSGLVNLTSLDLSGNGIGAAGAQALSRLINLTWLDLADSGVRDLSPLLKLTKLEHLDCSGCQIDDAAPMLWRAPSLKTVILHEASLAGAPPEMLSLSRGEDCREKLRAHFADLEAGESEATDFKVMFLGNGRVGKTQVCRRLQGADYDPAVPSTHGVHVASAPLACAQGASITLKLWDFGGQEIYHGTHALFLKSRSVFLLAWTPEAEKHQAHQHGGFTFRNQPLGYWLAYVRQFGGPHSPVLVVQTQCDEPEQVQPNPPTQPGALDGFPFREILHYSARKNRGRAALDEALTNAVNWLKEQRGPVRIGVGRAKVKAKLEKLYAKGGRLIGREKYRDICKKTGGVSSPSLLLDYLHNIGAVFYREGLFGDAIILDQAWVLDAVYAAFDRESKAFAYIQRLRGRFRRSDLAEWVWQKHGTAEQELFLSFMQQCGVCFKFLKEDWEKGIEAEYIAPDLLPDRNDPVTAMELRQKWDDRCDAEAKLVYELLPPGLMRSLIAKIGVKAGLAGEYWRDGFYFYDEKVDARALVEQRWTLGSAGGWAGEIHVRTQRGQARVLLDQVLTFIIEQHEALGAQPILVSLATADDPKAPRRRIAGTKPMLEPGHEPSRRPEYYVS